PKKAIIAVLVIALIAAVGFAASHFADGGSEDVGAPPPEFQLSAAEVETAEAQLAELEVKPKAPMDGYTGNREALFGPAWTDKAEGVAMAGNGCDTRNDILQRDLVEIVLDDDDCTVLTGVLL